MCCCRVRASPNPSRVYDEPLQPSQVPDRPNRQCDKVRVPSAALFSVCVNSSSSGRQQHSKPPPSKRAPLAWVRRAKISRDTEQWHSAAVSSSNSLLPARHPTHIRHAVCLCMSGQDGCTRRHAQAGQGWHTCLKASHLAQVRVSAVMQHCLWKSAADHLCVDGHI